MGYLPDVRRAVDTVPMNADIVREKKSLRMYLRANFDALSDLPEPDERWTYLDLCDCIEPHLQKLIEIQGVEHVGENEEGYKEFKVNEEAYEILLECREGRMTLPCGYSGFKNIGGGFYTCSFDRCDHRYTRETLHWLLESPDHRDI